MNRIRVLITFVVAVALGLVVSIYVYRVLQRAAATQQVKVSTIQVVVAVARLPLGSNLQEQDVKTISWPVGAPMTGMFTQAKDCVGRTLTTPVEENEPILETKLAPLGAGGGMPATIPEGMRAISVAVNDVIGVAGFVQPGTMVDVLVTGSPENSPQKLTRTILEDVRVLAAGQKVEQDKQGQPQTVPVVTLLVTPEQANSLALASNQGKIQLALRNAVDTKKLDPPAVYEAALFGGAPPQSKRSGRVARGPSAPVLPATFTVEVIRGDKKELHSFPNP
jgi:pilus assembly protein CpaB